MQATIGHKAIHQAGQHAKITVADRGDPDLDPQAPQLRALLDYWNARRGERPFILWPELHPREILPLLPLVFVLDVENGPRRYRIRLMGTGIVRRFGGEFTGRCMDELDFGTARAKLLSEYDIVADRVAPHHAFCDYRQQGGGQMQAERLALPMSTDGRAANRILGAVIHTPYGMPGRGLIGLGNGG